MTFTVQSAIDAYVQRHYTEREPDGKLHPSGLFGCQRQAVYAFRGTPITDPRTYQSKRTLFIGKLTHLQVQQALSEHPDVMEAYHEVRLESPDLNIVGSADTLILVKRKDGKWILVEIKSIKGMAVKYKKLPQEDHVGQGFSYMRSLRKFGCVVNDDEAGGQAFLNTTDPRISWPNGGDLSCERVIPPLGDLLTDLLIAYVIKDDWTTQEYWLEWSDEAEGKVTGRVDSIWPYTLDSKSLPPRLPLVKGKRAWNCGYCSWAKQCWDKDPDEIKPVEDVW